MKMTVSKSQSNDILQDVFADKNIQEGEGGVPENLNAIKTLKKNLTLFNSTYIWLRAFSDINFGRSEFCSRFTGEPPYPRLHTFFFSFKSHRQKPARDIKHQKVIV